MSSPENSSPLAEIVDAIFDSQILANLVIFITLFTTSLLLFIIGYYIIELLFMSFIIISLYRHYKSQQK